MNLEKTIKGYAKRYRKALIAGGMPEVDAEAAAYEKRLREMYAADDFRTYSQYPTTDAVRVYAAIAIR